MWCNNMILIILQMSRIYIHVLVQAQSIYLISAMKELVSNERIIAN